MKNGKALYKIKAEIIHSNQNIKFELQIKSLINHLWGEVEHSSFYKGYNYTLSFDYHKKLMGNLYKHLEAVDKQLEFLSNHFETKEGKENKETKEIICKLLSFKFSKLLNDELNIVIDLREIFEVVIDCLIRLDGEKETLKKVSNFSPPIEFKEFTYTELNDESEIDKVVLSKKEDIFWKIFISLLSTVSKEKFRNSFSCLLDKLIPYKQIEVDHEIYDTEIQEYFKENVEKALIASFCSFKKISYLSITSVNLIRKVVESYYDVFSEEIGDLILEEEIDQSIKEESAKILKDSILYILDKKFKPSLENANLTPENIERLYEEIEKIREEG